MNLNTTANILIVDDNIENLRILSDMLHSQGFDVRPVTGGRQALQAAQSEAPDLILLDITMPEMDGYVTCSQLKQQEALKDIPIIFLTALSDTPHKMKAFGVGGVDYVTKPFQLEEVLARVKTHLELRRARLELRQSYNQLRSLEQLRDELVHMIIHDMRSPLMAISWHLSSLQSVGLDAEFANDLRLAVSAANTVNQMANDLLDTSRLEAGKMPLTRAQCDLVLLANEVRESLSGLDQTRVIEVTTSDPAVVSCDVGLVRRIIENLVSNAIKHTPPSGRIQISATSDGSIARATVSDEGQGIPDQDKQRIFDKFGTLAARSERKYHSVGLGLAFCKLAVEAHLGTLGVKDGETRGSVFWFELPA